MSLRILLTCEDYLPHVGGAEVYVAKVSEELQRLGHHTTIFTNTMDRLPDDAGAVRLPWRFSPRGLWNHMRALWTLIGSHDVIHCTYSFRIAAICALIARMRGKPLLLTQQGRGIVPEVHPRVHHAVLFYICQVLSMKLARHITATSEEIADLSAAFVARDKITVISNGYDAQLFSPEHRLPVPPEFRSLSQGMKRLLTVRRLVPKNGIHILVQALALVKERDPHFHYSAIGEGRARAYIEQLVKDLHLTGHVTLLGAKPNEQTAAYVQHADLVLFPSSAEAQSIACIEAMGMGTPVIASRVGGLIDLLGEDSAYGLLVKIYDSEASNYEAPQTLSHERLQPLADAILDFFQNPAVFQERADRARRKVLGAYSWKAVTQRYLAMYRKIGIDC